MAKNGDMRMRSCGYADIILSTRFMGCVKMGEKWAKSYGFGGGLRVLILRNRNRLFEKMAKNVKKTPPDPPRRGV